MYKTDLGILFDCDGTLTDSLDQALVSFVLTFQELGLTHITENEILKLFGISADKILRHFVGDDLDKSELAFELFLSNQKKLALETRLHYGISAVIEAFAQMKVPMGIVTGRHVADLDILLSPHGLSEFFPVKICDNMVNRPKPDPQGIWLACKQLHIEPTQMLYLGDSVVDIQAAHASGCTSIAALWDSHVNEASLLAENPAYCIRHPEELLDVWDDFKQKSRSN
jgi:pyrophosphatase PpaX